MLKDGKNKSKKDNPFARAIEHITSTKEELLKGVQFNEAPDIVKSFGFDPFSQILDSTNPNDYDKIDVTPLDMFYTDFQTSLVKHDFNNKREDNIDKISNTVNHLLLVGPKGSGRSTMLGYVYSILQYLKTETNIENIEEGKKFLLRENFLIRGREYQQNVNKNPIFAAEIEDKISTSELPVIVFIDDIGQLSRTWEDSRGGLWYLFYETIEKIKLHQEKNIMVVATVSTSEYLELESDPASSKLFEHFERVTTSKYYTEEIIEKILVKRLTKESKSGYRNLFNYVEDLITDIAENSVYNPLLALEMMNKIIIEGLKASETSNKLTNEFFYKNFPEAIIASQFVKSNEHYHIDEKIISKLSEDNSFRSLETNEDIKERVLYYQRLVNEEHRQKILLQFLRNQGAFLKINGRFMNTEDLNNPTFITEYLLNLSKATEIIEKDTQYTNYHLCEIRKLNGFSTAIPIKPSARVSKKVYYALSPVMTVALEHYYCINWPTRNKLELLEKEITVSQKIQPISNNENNNLDK